MSKKKIPGVISLSKIEDLEELQDEQIQRLEMLAESELPEVSGPAKRALKEAAPTPASDSLYQEILRRANSGSKEERAKIPILLEQLRRARTQRRNWIEDDNS